MYLDNVPTYFHNIFIHAIQIDTELIILNNPLHMFEH